MINLSTKVNSYFIVKINKFNIKHIQTIKFKLQDKNGNLLLVIKIFKYKKMIKFIFQIKMINKIITNYRKFKMINTIKIIINQIKQII